MENCNQNTSAQEIWPWVNFCRVKNLLFISTIVERAFLVQYIIIYCPPTKNVMLLCLGFNLGFISLDQNCPAYSLEWHSHVNQQSRSYTFSATGFEQSFWHYNDHQILLDVLTNSFYSYLLSVFTHIHDQWACFSTTTKEGVTLLKSNVQFPED